VPEAAARRLLGQTTLKMVSAAVDPSMAIGHRDPVLWPQARGHRVIAQLIKALLGIFESP